MVLFKPLAVGISPVCCPGFLWFVGIAVGIAPGLLLVFLWFVAPGIVGLLPWATEKTAISAEQQRSNERSWEVAAGAVAWCLLRGAWCCRCCCVVELAERTSYIYLKLWVYPYI